MRGPPLCALLRRQRGSPPTEASKSATEAGAALRDTHCDTCALVDEFVREPDAAGDLPRRGAASCGRAGTLQPCVHRQASSSAFRRSEHIQNDDTVVVWPAECAWWTATGRARAGGRESSSAHRTAPERRAGATRLVVRTRQSKKAISLCIRAVLWAPGRPCAVHAPRAAAVPRRCARRDCARGPQRWGRAAATEFPLTIRIAVGSPGRKARVPFSASPYSARMLRGGVTT